jgi:hypothetical protein
LTFLNIKRALCSSFECRKPAWVQWALTEEDTARQICVPFLALYKVGERCTSCLVGASCLVIAIFDISSRAASNPLNYNKIIIKTVHCHSRKYCYFFPSSLLSALLLRIQKSCLTSLGIGTQASICRDGYHLLRDD